MGPFQELRRYRAVVLFPWDPAVMAFWELYALGTAVLVPQRDWAFKVQQFSGWIFSQPSGAVELAGLKALEGAEAALMRPNYTHSPWWEPKGSIPDQVLYWYAYSDFER